MSIAYSLFRFMSKHSSPGFRENVTLNSIGPSIRDFLEPTELVKDLIVFIREAKVAMIITPRLYDVGKRLTMSVIEVSKKTHEIIKKTQLELSNKGISCSIRISSKDRKKQATYFLLEGDYDEKIISILVSTIIIDVFDLNGYTPFDIKVKTWVNRVLKPLPSDPKYEVGD